MFISHITRQVCDIINSDPLSRCIFSENSSSYHFGSPDFSVGFCNPLSPFFRVLFMEEGQQNVLQAHSRVWNNFWQLKAFWKLMKNTFYFMLKVLFFLKILTFLFWLFGHVGKRLDKKAKFVTSQTGKQSVHLLPNISKSKGNQIVKFGQLIDYNVRNMFVQRSCRKWGRNTRSRPLFVF